MWTPFVLSDKSPQENACQSAGKTFKLCNSLLKSSKNGFVKSSSLFWKENLFQVLVAIPTPSGFFYEWRFEPSSHHERETIFFVGGVVFWTSAPSSRIPTFMTTFAKDMWKPNCVSQPSTFTASIDSKILNEFETISLSWWLGCCITSKTHSI